MTVRSATNLLLVGIIAGLPGCTPGRTNIAELSKSQAAYYEDVAGMLADKRLVLELGLEHQLKVDLARRRNLLQWERDLREAEVLLVVDANVTGNQRLLSMKLAELDVEAAGRVATLRQIDRRRQRAIMNLYDRVEEAVETLRENNNTIVEYLTGSDRAFALESLDVDGIFAAAAAVRSAQEELGTLDKRSREEKEKENERVRDALRRTRNILIQALSQ